MKNFGLVSTIALLGLFLSESYAQQGMGVGTNNPLEMMQIEGAIKIGTDFNNTNAAPTGGAGTIRWNGTNFQGWDGSQWIDFTGSGGAAGWELTGNSGTTPGTNFIGTTDNVDLRIRTNNTDQITVRTNGRVGIGTTTPTGHFHTELTNGNFRLWDNNGGGGKVLLGGFTGNTGLAPQMRFAETGVGDFWDLGMTDDNYFTIERNDADKLVIDDNGNVGIGTSAPLVKLDVVGSEMNLRYATSYSGVQMNLTGHRHNGVSGNPWNHSTTGFATINFKNRDASNANTEYIGARITSVNEGASDDGDLRFYTTSDQTQTEAMRISYDGNVGIGAVANEKLHVAGNIRMVDGNQQTGYIPVSDANGTMTWTDPATISTASVDELVDADNDTKVQVEESADEDIIRFDVAGTETWKMVGNRLESSNVNHAVYIGENAGASEGNSNLRRSVFIGENAGQGNISGNNNVALGYQSQMNRTDGNMNVAIGSKSLESNTGSNNTVIGHLAGQNSGSGSSNVFIGHSVGQNETGSDKLYIDNSNTSDPLIYGEFDNNIVGINGSLGVGTQSPSEKLTVWNGDAIIGGNQNVVDRGITLYGARNGTSNTAWNTFTKGHAFINFDNYDGGNSAVQYTGAVITSVNNPGSDDGDLRFLTASDQVLTEAMRITYDGNVGIGDHPSERFHVAGNIRMVDGNQQAGYVPVSDANGTMSWADPNTLISDGDWTVSGNDQYSAVSGNVGIGTTTPDHKFQVVGLASFGADGHLVSGNRNVAFGQSNSATNNNSIVAGFQSHTEGNITYALGYQDTIGNVTGSGIIGGRRNTITASYGFIGGGDGNEITAAQGFIGGGLNNTVSATNAAAFGDGNTVSGARAFVTGYGNTASGGNSLSFGRDNTNTSGANSLVGGAENTVSTQMALAVGAQNTASGYASFVANRGNVASGNHTAAFGVNNTAASYNEFVVGMNATEYTPNSAIGHNVNDRVFVVGDGTGTTNRSNALTVYKSGTVNINDAYDLPNTDGTSGYVMTTDGSGTVSWTDPATLADPDWTVSGNNIYNSNSGFVGVGTNAPNSKLTVGDPFSINMTPIVRINTSGNQPLLVGESTTPKAVMIGYDGNDIQGRTGAGLTTNGNLILNQYGGNVGIGDNTPDAKLDVEGSIQMVDGNQAAGYIPVSDANGTMTWTDPATITTAYEDQLIDADGDTKIQVEETADDDVIRFDAEGLEVMVIEKNGTEGMVGIGTTDPRSEMHISDGSASAKTVNDQFGYGASITITDNNIPRIYFEAQGQAANKKLMDISLLNQKLSIGSLNDAGTSFDNQYIISAHRDGNVGIGTGNATTKLYVAESASVSTVATIETGSGQWPTTLYLKPTSHATSERAALTIGNWGVLQDFAGSGDENFSIWQGAPANTQRMTITTAGNVGFGTNAAAEKLHVVGNIRMVDGNQAVGYIPVSDANGTMTWTDPASVVGAQAWSLSGNAGTTAGTDFLGTTDAQDFGIRTNNLERITVMATGTAINARVGIGTNTVSTIPVGQSGLEIAGNVPNLVLNDLTGGAQDDFAIVNGGGTANFMNATTSTTVMAIGLANNSNNVGIGTTTPEEAFEIKRTGSNPVQTFHSSGVGSYKLGNDGSVFKIAAMDNGYGGHTGDFAANDVQTLAMTNTGNVGVGTTAPASRLHIQTTASGINLPLFLRNTSSTTGDGTGIGFVSEPNGDWAKGGIFFERTGGFGTGKLHFLVDNAADNQSVTTAESRMTITPLGNVGIGETAPNAKLDVAGDVDVNTNGIKFTDTENGNATVELRASDPSYPDEGVTLRTLSNPAAGEPIFRVMSSGGAERLRVEHSGAVAMNNTVRIEGGNPGVGKVLTSTDNVGNATWQEVGVPSGAVMFFNLPACPSGWSDMNAAQGRYLVGVPNGGTLAGTVGSALSNQENRATGAHTHSVNPPSTNTTTNGNHNHDFYTANNDVNNSGSQGYPFGNNHLAMRTTDRRQRTEDNGTIRAEGNHAHSVDIPAFTSGSTGVAGTNAPYIQLKVCQKD